MSSGLKTNLQNVSTDFCTNSTAHGVQHLSVKEKSFPKMFFWSLIFIATVMGSGMHLYFLVSSYLEYNYYETITNDMEKALVFPSVTICDPYALSALRINQYLPENMQVIYKMALMSHLAWEYVKDNHTADINNEIYIHHLLTLQSVFANSPVGKKHINSISLQELLVWCSYGEQDCGYENFTLYIHPRYLNCYTFKPSKMDPTVKMPVGPEYGFSIILRAQQVTETDPVYEVFTNIGNTIGFLVSLHEPGTIPHIYDTSFRIDPGRSTSIGLKQKTFERIQTPKVSCQDEEWFETPSGIFKKSYNTCNKICKLDFIIRKCFCTSTSIAALLPDDNNYCLRINTSNFEETMKRGICETKNFGSSDDKLKECLRSCLWPCYQIKYEKQIFSSEWPNSGAIPDFLSKYVMTLEDSNPIKMFYTMLQESYTEMSVKNEMVDTSTVDVNAFFDMIMEIMMENKFSTDLMNRLLANKSLGITVDPVFRNLTSLEKAQEQWVKKTFYRLTVYWSESAVEVHKQVLSYSTADLWSSVGGILGLWTGVSIITLVEFIAFIGAVCKVICQYCSGTLNKTKVSPIV